MPDEIHGFRVSISYGYILGNFGKLVRYRILYHYILWQVNCGRLVGSIPGYRYRMVLGGYQEVLASSCPPYMQRGVVRRLLMYLEAEHAVPVLVSR